MAIQHTTSDGAATRTRPTPADTISGLSSQRALCLLGSEIRGFLQRAGPRLLPPCSIFLFLYHHKQQYVSLFVANLLLMLCAFFLFFLIAQSKLDAYLSEDHRLDYYSNLYTYEPLVLMATVMVFTIMLVVISYRQWRDSRIGLALRLSDWAQRVQAVATRSLSDSGSGDELCLQYTDLNCPFFRGLQTVRAVRDGALIWAPIDLLVQGDIVLLSLGESVEAELEELGSDTGQRLAFQLDSPKFQVYHRIGKSPFISKLEKLLADSEIGHAEPAASCSLPVRRFFLGQPASTSPPSHSTNIRISPNGQSSTNTVLLPPVRRLSALNALNHSYQISDSPNLFIGGLLVFLSVMLLRMYVAYDLPFDWIIVPAFFVTALVYLLPIWSPFTRFFIELLEAYADARLAHLWETLESSTKPFLERGETAQSNGNAASSLAHGVSELMLGSGGEEDGPSTEMVAMLSDREDARGEEAFRDDTSTSMASSLGFDSSVLTSQDVSDHVDDCEEDDAFDDEAAPPTQDVSLSRSRIWIKWWSRLTCSRRTQRPPILFAPLANVSVVLTNQEKGVLFAPFPVPEEVVVFTCEERLSVDENMARPAANAPEPEPGAESALEEQKTSESNVLLLDLVPDDTAEGGVRFEDVDWKKYASSLQPLAYCLAFGHPILEPAPSGLALATPSGSSSASVFQPVATGQASHLVSERKRRMRSHLSTHWLPHHLRRRSHRAELTLPSSAHALCLDCPFHHVYTSGHQTCYCNFGYAIGQSAQLFKRMSSRIDAAMGHVIAWTDAQMKTVQYKRRWLQYFMMLSCAELESDSAIEDESDSGSEREKRPGTGPDREEVSVQIVGQGDFIGILGRCTDLWNGSVVEPMSEEHLKKIRDCGLYEERNYLQVVAYSIKVARLKLSQAEKEALSSPYWMKWIDREQCGDSQDAFQLYRAGEDVPLDPSSQLHRLLVDVMTGHTFVGLMGLGSRNKEDICEAIRDFAQAGIRFVYCSSRDERSVKDIGDRLDLETDWNSCITLSSPPTGPPTPQMSSAAAPAMVYKSGAVKGHLPRGIGHIRPHLTLVDDIPLHVNLFAEAGVDEIREMIRIYKEAGEVVCYWGSSLSGRDLPLYLESHVSIATDPYPALEALKLGPGPLTALLGSLAGSAKTSKAASRGGLAKNALALVASLHQTLCYSLHLRMEMSPYIITQMIQEARSFQHNFNQCVSFCVSSSLSLTILGSVAILALGWPMPMSMAGFAWMTCILLPFLSASLLCVSAEPDIMKWMPGKQNRAAARSQRPASDMQGHASVNKSLEGEARMEAGLAGRAKRRDILLERLRFLSPRTCFVTNMLTKWWLLMVVSVVLYYLATKELLAKVDVPFPVFYPLTATKAFSTVDPHHRVLAEPFGPLNVSWCIKYSQNIFMFVFILVCWAQSMTLIHQVLSIREFPPFRCTWWVFAYLVAIPLQVSYTAISLYGGPLSAAEVLSSLPMSFWVILVVSLPCLVIYQELLLKNRDRSRYLRSQKRSKLEFNTKLGMHSPI